MTFRMRSSATLLLCVALACLSLGAVRASYLTGSDFPFEMCKIRAQEASRFDAQLYKYRENPKGSSVCFLLRLKPREECKSPGTRCCNTIFNKFKMYIDGRCHGSIRDIKINGRSTSSIQYERPKWGNKIYDIAKITNIDMKPWEVDQTMLCFNIRGKCNTLSQLTAPELRDAEYFEFSMYDKKVDNYECCPMFVTSTTHWGGVRGIPMVPNWPALPPRAPFPATDKTNRAPPRPPRPPPSPPAPAGASGEQATTKPTPCKGKGCRSGPKKVGRKKLLEDVSSFLGKFA